MESVKVIDSMKIFNHLEYNSPETPDAPAAGASEPWPNPSKSRRWKGKKP
jgi:hypothetical protein